MIPSSIHKYSLIFFIRIVNNVVVYGPNSYSKANSRAEGCLKLIVLVSLGVADVR